MAKRPACYGAIPARMFEDTTLSGLDMRVMGIVAARDWMSQLRGNGAGCILSFRQIAKIADAHFSSITKSISKLERAGYITIGAYRKDRRRKSLIVNYDQERDLVVMDKAKNVGGSANDLEPEMSENVGDMTNDFPENVGGSANYMTEIVGEANSQPYEIYEEYGSQDITLNVERDYVKRGKIFCEAARSQNAIAAAYAKIDSSDDYENVTAFLAIVERELGRTPSLTTPQLIEALDQLNSDTRDNRIANHALRLIEKFSPEDGEDGLGSGSQDEPPVPLSEQDAKFMARIRSTWAEVGDDPEKRKLLATKSGLSLSTIAAVTQGHVYLTPPQIKKLRDACVSI